MADDKFAWAPSSGMLSGIEEDGDGYRLYFDEGHVDIEEDSRDSEEGIDAISRIASASESCSTIVSTFLVLGASIGDIMTEIQKMEIVTSDLEFHSRCCQLMMFKPVREMILSLKGYEQRFLDWLKHTSYNPLPFIQN
ncbi:hypothetical protein S83_032567 [Arachis hypogaea]